MAENTKTDGISTAAWMTEEPKMLLFDRAEAESYCDDEEPDPLVRLSDAELLIAELREDLEESDAVRDRCAHLLAETAVALKGPEKALHRHGWQDLPEVAIKLRAELAHARLFMPAQRAERSLEPVNRIGPTNFAFYGIVETDDEFAERAGTKVENN